MQQGANKLTNITENTIKCLFVDYLGDLGWSQRAVEAEEVCGETSGVSGKFQRRFVCSHHSKWV